MVPRIFVIKFVNPEDSKSLGDNIYIFRATEEFYCVTECEMYDCYILCYFGDDDLIIDDNRIKKIRDISWIQLTMEEDTIYQINNPLGLLPFINTKVNEYKSTIFLESMDSNLRNYLENNRKMTFKKFSLW